MRVRLKKKRVVSLRGVRVEITQAQEAIVKETVTTVGEPLAILQFVDFPQYDVPVAVSELEAV